MSTIETQSINQESNISQQKDLESQKLEIQKLQKQILALKAKEIKSKPLEENIISTDDQLTLNSFEELKKNKNLLKRDNKSLLKNHIDAQENENPILICDLSKLVTQHLNWIENLPFVKPCYAIKCNNDHMIAKTLKDFGCGFDCASMEEVRQVLDLGVSPNSIIFANPIKPVSHLKFAYEKGVDYMTFDNADELVKIKKYHPNAKLVIRIRVDDSSSLCQFGAKFGVHAGLTRELIEKIHELKMNLVGVSFHVGSGCADSNAYYEAIKASREVFDEAEEYGMKLSLLDIGGGFVSEDLSGHSKVIRESFNHFFSDLKVRVIGEPGRYYATPAMEIGVNVTGRREIIGKKDEKEKDPKIEIDNSRKYMYYVSDGAYATFNSILYDHWEVQKDKKSYFIQEGDNLVHKSNNDLKSEKKFLSTIWGPTCDSLDCITKNYPMPELHIGDWMVFEDFGAYTISAGCEFNGFPRPSRFYYDTMISKKVEREMAEVYNYDF